VEPLLRIVDELERRDEDAAAALLEIEALQHEVEETRARAAAIVAFLAAFPDALAARVDEQRAAAESRTKASASLAEAEAELAQAAERGREDARLAAERAVQHARDALREAGLRVERAQAERARLEREERQQHVDAERLLLTVEPLARRLAGNPRVATRPPGPGLEGVLEWGSRARGDLLLAHAGLATERDKVVREATELVASALGEPLPGNGVAGVRQRIERG
jgi:hypothetical protein